MLVYRFENFRAKLILDVLVLCEQVKSARERIRRRIHSSEDEGARIIVSATFAFDDDAVR